MAALTITPADASPAPGPAPAAAPGTGATGFDTAYQAALGGPQQAAGGLATPAGQAAGPPSTTEPTGTEAPPTLLGAAAALAALLGRALPAAQPKEEQDATAPVPIGDGSDAQAGVAPPSDRTPPLDGRPQLPPAQAAVVPPKSVAPPTARPGGTGAEQPAPGIDGAVVAAASGTRAPAEPSTRPADGTQDEDAPAQPSVDVAVQADVAAALLPVPPLSVPLVSSPPSPASPPSAARAGASIADIAISGAAGASAAATGLGRTDRTADARPAAAPAQAPASASASFVALAADAVSAAAAPATTGRDRAAASVDRSTVPGPVAQLAPAGPVLQPAPTVPVAAPASVPTVVAISEPSVAQQLQGPLLSLRSAPEGEHVLVVRVSPDHLGPVTLHATVSHGDLAVQLFAASTDARDALSAMMTDLRRDLGAGAAGSATTLSLGTGDAPQQDGRGQQAASWLGADAGRSGAGPSREDRPVRGTPPRVADDIPAARPILTSSSALLDVLA